MKIMLTAVAFLMMATVASAQTTSSTLTPAQCATLKTDITADATLNTARTGRQDDVIATAYNATASPAFWVWKSKLSRSDIVLGTSVDATTFNIAGLTARTAQEVLAFQTLFDPITSMTNPMNPRVRVNFGALQDGAAPQPANITHMTAMARRTTNRLERLFATGTGSTGSPGLMVFEGPATTQLIACALNLP